MSYNGRYYRGYNRTVREIRRAEAEERNSRTPVERTRRYRLATPEARLLMGVFITPRSTPLPDDAS